MNALEIVIAVLVPATTLGFIHYAIHWRVSRLLAYIFGVGVIGLTLTGLWLNHPGVASWVVVAWFWMATGSAGVTALGCYGWDEWRAKNNKIGDLEAQKNAR